MLAKLSELLFVEAVQRYAEALPQGQTGWLAGLRDPYVARALALLHRDIGRPWNVDDLGREVGLSRSALADNGPSIFRTSSETMGRETLRLLLGVTLRWVLKNSRAR